MKLFVATKAFINYNGNILVLRESGKYVEGTNQGSYDVVGGRLTPGEHFRDALLREVKEETGLDVTIGKPFFVNEWRPVVKDEQWHIVGIFFECFAESDAVTLSDDHDDFKWISAEEYEEEGVIKNLKAAFEAYLDR